MFGGLLSAINVAGGGIPLAARGAIVGGVSSGNARSSKHFILSYGCPWFFSKSRYVTSG